MPPCLHRRVPVKRLALADGETLVACVHDLFLANYGVDRGSAATTSPQAMTRWRPIRRPGPRRSPASAATRSSRWRANSRPMPRRPKAARWIIIGAAMNHWFHADMNYRGVINMLCSGGWSANRAAAGRIYVGREKLRPQAVGRRSPSRWIGAVRRAAELHLGLLRAYRPVALRDDECGHEHHLPNCARRGPWADRSSTNNIRAEADGLAASAPAVADQPVAGRP